MFALVYSLFVLAVWNSLSAGVGYLFGRVMLGLCVGNTWLALSMLLGFIMGRIIKNANEAEPYYHTQDDSGEIFTLRQNSGPAYG